MYKNKIRHEQYFITYSIFISFFPLLVAVPIDKAESLILQFNNLKRKIPYQNLYAKALWSQKGDILHY